MSMYVTMSSNKGKEHFPNNKAYKFTCHLRAPLILNGIWRIALVETDITSNLSKTDPIYFFFSNIRGESIVDKEQKPLLRRLTAVDMANWSTILNTPHYVPVRVNEIYDITTDSQNQVASFLDNTSTVQFPDIYKIPFLNGTFPKYIIFVSSKSKFKPKRNGSFYYRKVIESVKNAPS